MESEDARQQFQQRIQADRQAGREQPLARYQELFPGHEELIAREYERVRGDAAKSGRITTCAEESGPPSAFLERLAEFSPPRMRYQLGEELARGGMGAVLRVWDESLRRDLAMKVVLSNEDRATQGPTHAPDPRTLGRFLEEAQVTGQLDHPGIVPVHELGVSEERGVYFTMKLVRGEDLRAVFAKVREGEEGWTKTRALGVLLKVCEAMAYAHDKGVIHRDLKPANVMVGKYGEVYVMDWGLARVRGEEDRHDLRLRSTVTTAVRTARTEAADESPFVPILTMDGTVVGTPAYMPPEQAEGRREELGPRSDVYAMGAMLYELLTGQAPYVRPGSRASPLMILGALVSGPPKPVHELAPGVAAELEAICEKAMAREPEERYRDMGELAADLSAYLEHRVVRAYRTGAVVELRKWVERNKGLAATSAAALIALVAGLITSSVLFVEARDNAELARRNADEAKKQAEVARENEQRADLEARTARRTADFLTGLFEVVDPGEARGNTVTAREILDRGASKIDAELREEPEVRANLMGTMGVVYSRLGLYQAALPLLRGSLEERRKTLGDEDERVAESRNDLGETLRLSADYEGAERELRAALDVRRRLLGEHPAVAESLHDLGAVLAERGNPQEAEALLRESLELRRKLLGRHPDVAESLNELAFAIYDQHRTEGVEDLLREALELRTELLGTHPSTAESVNNLGLLLYEQGRKEEAIPLFRTSLDMKRQLFGAVHPDTATTLNNLAFALHDSGDLAGAEELYRSAIEQQRALLGDAHPSLGQALNNLAFVLRDRGDYDGARDGFFEAVATYRRALGDEHKSVINAVSNAEHLVRETIERRESELGAEHNETVRARLDLAELFRIAGRPVDARPVAEEVWQLLSGVPDADGVLAARAESVLGAVLADLGEREEAEELLRAGFTRLLEFLGPAARETSLSGGRLAALFELTNRPEEAARVRSLLTSPDQGD